MNIAKPACIVACAYLFGVTATLAQIRYLTVRSPKSPLPAMSIGVVPGNTNAAAANPIAPPLASAPVALRRVAPPPAKPSLDKPELDRRVVEFQKKRASEGSDSAQYELGVRYLNGDGVDRDLDAARKWLSLSAQAGNAQAQRKLQELPGTAK